MAIASQSTTSPVGLCSGVGITSPNGELRAPTEVFSPDVFDEISKLPSEAREIFDKFLTEQAFDVPESTMREFSAGLGVAISFIIKDPDPMRLVEESHKQYRTIRDICRTIDDDKDILSPLESGTTADHYLCRALRNLFEQLSDFAIKS